MGHDPAHARDVQSQLDALVRHVAVNRADIDALEARADKSDLRAEAAEARADAADARADIIEARAQVDRDMIAELQDEGVLSREHAAQMEQALKSSRTIGAALGLIMAGRHVCEDEAFLILREASQKSNRKLRELAHELVTTGGLSAPLL